MECFCVISAVVTGLTVAGVIEIYSSALDMECMITGASLFYTKLWIFSQPVFFGMDLEVILVSLISLCVSFYFIRRRIHNRQIAILLRNSVIQVAINASIMGLDSFRVGYYIIMYLWAKFRSSGVFPAWDTVTGFGLTAVIAVVFVASVIIQAVLCIQTSTEGSIKVCLKRCCCMLKIMKLLTEGTLVLPPTQLPSRASPLSHTNFTIPYTGAFTQIRQCKSWLR